MYPCISSSICTSVCPSVGPSIHRERMKGWHVYDSPEKKIRKRKREKNAISDCHQTINIQQTLACVFAAYVVVIASSACFFLVWSPGKIPFYLWHWLWKITSPRPDLPFTQKGKTNKRGFQGNDTTMTTTSSMVVAKITKDAHFYDHHNDTSFC